MFRVLEKASPVVFNVTYSLQCKAQCSLLQVFLYFFWGGEGKEEKECLYSVASVHLLGISHLVLCICDYF